MDLGMEGVALMIASSTSNYLVVFSPIFLLVGGLMLAMFVLFLLIDSFAGWLLYDVIGIKRRIPDEDDGYADGEYMASLPGMSDEDRRYYRSNEYPGNRRRM